MSTSRSRLGRALALARSVRHHALRGSLVQALRQRLRPAQTALRFNAQTEADAIAQLPQLAQRACRPGAETVLVVGVEGSFLQAVLKGMAERGLKHRSLAPEAAGKLGAADVAGVGCIVLALLDARGQFAAARQLLANPVTHAIALEYLSLPRRDNVAIADWDFLRNEDFVSPQLSRHGALLFDIYRESLTRFRRKTEIRDYLDLSQLLESVIDRGIAGDIAEFGSFQGHSGYLMSQVLEQLGGQDKRLFLFDMFENFPEEEVGVDRFWSGSHKVDFAVIQQKFADRAKVSLVKGDFTQTLLGSEATRLSLAFIDCDSYRATRFLLPELWQHRLSVGGIVILEDYGHAALLGNRLAAHEFFDGRRDAFTYFSQFSGFFVAVKLA